MPHSLTHLTVDSVTRPTNASTPEVGGDVCVVGAGIAGLSAALESARLGHQVVLVDALPLLGGQCVNSLIGLFCGVYGNAPEYRQLTHGIFDDMFADLSRTGDIEFIESHTRNASYDEVAVGRWIEDRVLASGIKVLTGASVRSVDRDGDRITGLTASTRHGDVRVSAQAYVDASGDASLTWEAGFECRVPERTIWGSQQVRIEGIRRESAPSQDDLVATLRRLGDDYGLSRKEGLVFYFPGRDTAVLNMTHVEAPLEPSAAARAQLTGRVQADRVVEFLRTEFPEAFGDARVRLYGFPGRRQTRWISSLHELTVDEVRAGTLFDDAVARTAWPVELHDRIEGYVWEKFDGDHLHYVPLRSMLPKQSGNLIAAGRCVDGDAAALSSVRVMGPCAAMGHAAAHVFDLVGSGRPADVDTDSLRARIAENVID